MTDQPEALRIADLMAQRVKPRWIHATGQTPQSAGFKPDSECLEAVRLLREQHEEIEDLRKANEAFGKRQEWWSEKMFQIETEVEQLRNALYFISLASQNDMSSKEECGRIARAALEAPR